MSWEPFSTCSAGDGVVDKALVFDQRLRGNKSCRKTGNKNSERKKAGQAGFGNILSEFQVSFTSSRKRNLLHSRNEP